MTKHSQVRKPSTYLFNLSTTLYTRLLEKQNATFEAAVHGSDVPFVFNTVAGEATTTKKQKY